MMVAPAAAVLLPAPVVQSGPASAAPVSEPAGPSDPFGGRLADGLEGELPSANVSLLVQLRGAPTSDIILDYRARFGDQAAWPPFVVDSARAAIEERNATLGAQRTLVFGALHAAGVDAAPYRDYRYLVNGFNVRDVPAIAARILASNREVVQVERDHQVFVALAQSVPLINADDVWNLTDGLGRNITGQGALIANIDTGVDYSHPDLGGTLNRTNDLANLTAGTHAKFAKGWDFVNNDNDPWDGHLHGTHVAGIIGANGTVRGVAPNAKQLALKVLSDAGYGGDSDIIAAMQYATNPDGNALTNDAANASSMSLGGWDPNPDGLEPLAADQSTRLGTICVIAAGNDGATNSVGSPGVSRLAITVGSTTKSDVLSGFSSQGPTLGLDLKPDILAPGSSIVSTRWGGAGGTLTLSGTSMATPHVSGAIALLAQAHPNWTVNQTKSALVDTAVDLGYGVYQQGGGRMDVLAAVNTAVVATPHKIVMGRLDRLTNGTNTTVMLENVGTSSVTLNLSVRDIFGMNPDMTYTGNTADLNFVNTTAPNVTIAAGGRANITVVFAPSSAAVPGLYWGTLTAAGGNVSLRIPLAYAVRAPVLLVDDDSSERYPAQPAFDNFAGYPSACNNLSWSLTRLSMKHDIFTAVHYTDDGPKVGDLTQYPVVIWCTGYDQDYTDGFHTHHSISTNDRTALASYLDRGGQLWLIGENIGWEVSGHQNVSFGASNFFNAYLGVARVDNELNTPSPLKGTAGTFMNNTSYTTAATWSEYGNNGDYATNLTPTSRAFTIFNGSTTDVYGKTYANASFAVAVDNATYRSVFWGVEFSFLNTNSQFDDAVNRTMGFFAPRVAPSKTWAWEGETLNFTGRYGFLPNDGAFTFAWSFGDGGTASTRNATHTFLDEGPGTVGFFTVRFTVTSGAWLNLSGSVIITVYNSPPLVGSVTWVPANATEGELINFTGNCSDPGPLDTVPFYEWSFIPAFWEPDYRNPAQWAFGDNGTYNLTMRCSDNDGYGTAFNFSIVIGNANPVIRSINRTASAFENDTVPFSSNCTDPGWRDVLSLTWSWGDGSPDTVGPNATHAYGDEGNYTVTLTCTDDDGGTTFNTTWIQIGNLPPVLSLAGLSPIDEGAVWVPNATAFDPGPLDTLTYSWDFGDGSPVVAALAPSHLFVDDGDFTVRLTVTDNDGASSQANFTVRVANVAPTAVFHFDTEPTEGDAFVWTADVTDPGAADTHFFRYYDNGALTSSLLWADDGPYLITFYVLDHDGGETAYNFSGVILNAPPSMTGPAGTVPGDEGATIPLTANVSDPGPLDVLNITADFGDGSAPVTIQVRDWRADPLARFSHVFVNEGTYNVLFTADDGDGGQTSLAFVAVIVNGAPTLTLDPPGDLEVPEGSWVNITAITVDLGIGDLVTVAWRLGDSTVPLLGPSYSHFFPQDGVFVLHVTASDDAGAATEVTVNVTVFPVAPTLLSIDGPTSVVQGAPAHFAATAYDPGTEDLVTIWWSFGDDGQQGAGSSISHVFGVVGPNVVSLTLTDEDGLTTFSDITIQVTNAALSVTAITAHSALVEGRWIDFEAEVVNPADEALTYAWVFGDGETSNVPLPLHKYVDEGDFEVQVTVSEPDGVVVTFTQAFRIDNLPPTLSCLDCPSRVAQGSPFTFVLGAIDPGTTDNLTFLLRWDGGGRPPQASPNFTMTINGTGAIDITATVEDGDGGTDSYTLHIESMPDADRDGQYDAVDLDDDNDGTPDTRDPAPLDPAVREASAGFPWWLLVALAAAAGAGIFLVARRRRGAAGDEWEPVGPDDQ